jgi:hypothetical protein
LEVLHEVCPGERQNAPPAILRREFGLVATLGFLLMVSLVVSAALSAFGNQLESILPFGKRLLSGLNFAVSLMLEFTKVYANRHGSRQTEPIVGVAKGSAEPDESRP